MMTNREKLIKTNIYDLLCRINLEMPCFCVVQALGEEEKPDTCDNNCDRCIESWLNEEAQP